MKRALYLYVKAFSDFGSMMDTIVLSSLILTLTNSPYWLSGLLLMGVAGGSASALLSGVLADRYNRRTLMIWSDVLRGLCLLLLLIWPTPVVILAVRFVNGCLSSLFQIGFQSEIPRMFGEDRLVVVNSRIARYRSVSMVLGFLCGGTFAVLLGYRWVLVLDTLSFLLSAAALLAMKWEREAGQGQSKQKESLGRSFAGAWEYLRGNSVLLTVLVVGLIDTFGSASHNLGFPLLAELLDAGNQAFVYGCIWGIWGVGNVLMTVLMPKIPRLQERLIPFYLGCTVLMSTGFILTLSSSSLVPVLVFAFLTGIFDAGSVTANGMIVQSVENHVRGRVVGVATFLGQFGFGIGFVVAPLLVDGLGLAKMVWVLHGVVIVSTLGAIGKYRKFRKINPTLSA
ncbi:MFS transporter [Tumebacillus sp. ITR2]|uniref:MFS transporter n=1 Tax=Tumebacillus amylolyticus TaxID=2801339 RepID=A0ABS1JAY9_9BACL|nr:MFS transporter [Tumebacillus amylolyticus]MBL0387441.1 MFS transporter [Tumebacillus amylolyticus]